MECFQLYSILVTTTDIEYKIEKRFKEFNSLYEKVCILKFKHFIKNSFF